jgi:hypothetical protein
MGRILCSIVRRRLLGASDRAQVALVRNKRFFYAAISLFAMIIMILI